MAKKTLNEISRLDDPALTAVFDYLKDYDHETVILCYAECQRRGLPLSDKQQGRLNEYAKDNGFEDIEHWSKEFLEKHKLENFQELFSERASEARQNIVREQASQKGNMNRYPALNTLIGINKFFALVIGLLAAAIFLIEILKGSLDIVSGALILVIGTLLVLGLLAWSELIKVLIDIEYNTRQASGKK